MKKITLLILMVLVFAFNSATAQSTISTEKEKAMNISKALIGDQIAGNVSTKNVSPEKQKAIKELSMLLGNNNAAYKQISEQAYSLFEGRKQAIELLLEKRADLTDHEKSKLQNDLMKFADKYYEESKAKLLTELKYDSIKEEALIISYDKFYTLEEINDLIAFYKTPTGKKSLEIEDTFEFSITNATIQKSFPGIANINRLIILEMRNGLAKKAEELMPLKPKSEGK
jgi:uncharacterized protein